MSFKRLIHRAGSCNHGPCPNVFDVVSEPDIAAVQGIRETSQETLAQLPDMPAHEAVVLVPKAVLLEYARKITEEAPA